MEYTEYSQKKRRLFNHFKDFFVDISRVMAIVKRKISFSFHYLTYMSTLIS